MISGTFFNYFPLSKFLTRGCSPSQFFVGLSMKLTPNPTTKFGTREPSISTRKIQTVSSIQFLLTQVNSWKVSHLKNWKCIRVLFFLGILNDSLVTASHAIFVEKDGYRAPAAVVGLQFRSSALKENFFNFTSEVILTVSSRFIKKRCY